MIKDLAVRSRSYRRFYENESISYDKLKELVEIARYVPSTVNSQPLKFMLVNDADGNERVFSTLAWAGLLKEWHGPEKGERPSAYIVILGDLSVGKNKHLDVGITAQTMMLGAADMGYGGCMFGSIQREKLASLFDIDTEKYSIELVLALGKPKEDVRVVDLPESGSTAYYRDENGVHYVPKRSVDELIFECNQ